MGEREIEKKKVRYRKVRYRKRGRKKEREEGGERGGYNLPFLDTLKCLFQYPQLCSTSHLLPVGLLF